MYPRRHSTPAKRSPRLLVSATALLGLFAGLACAGSGPQPHRQLRSVWVDYSRLETERAMALAGELRSNRYVVGLSGGHPTRVEAETQALRECARLRLRRRMQAPCQLYAVGDEIVWSGPS